MFVVNGGLNGLLGIGFNQIKTVVMIKNSSKYDLK